MRKNLPVFKRILSAGALLLFMQPAMAQLSWTKPASLNTGLPASVEVFTSTTPIASGVATKAYYTLADLKDQNLELKVAYGGGTTSKTPMQYFAEEQREPAYVAMNGGFFSGSTSLSFVAQNGAVLSPNIKNFNRDFNSTPTPYYTTRGAFGILPNNTPDVAWIYNVGAANTTYSYTSPSPNRLGEAPQPVPTATSPEGAAAWNPSVGIGGAPVLVHNGVKRITDAEEMIVVDNTSRRARTAIGYTADKKLIMLVVEGGNAGVSEGVTLSELADIMLSLGAVEALNLDGGGSSSMVVKGETTIRPSDTGGTERPMPTALILKQRAPEPIILDTEMSDVFQARNGWTETGNAGFYGTSKARIVPTGIGNRIASYTFKNLESGRYEVSAWWVAASNRAKDTPFTVYQQGEAQPVVKVDQSVVANGSKFILLGTYELRANDSLVVTNLATAGSVTTYVTVDAIKLQKVGNLTASSKEAAVLASNVHVYPVPTDGKFYVTLPEAQRKQAQVRVVSLSGKVLYSKTNLHTNVLELDLSHVPAGVYLVEVQTTDGKVVKRVVKQ